MHGRLHDDVLCAGQGLQPHGGRGKLQVAQVPVVLARQGEKQVPGPAPRQYVALYLSMAPSECCLGSRQQAGHRAGGKGAE